MLTIPINSYNIFGYCSLALPLRCHAIDAVILFVINCLLACRLARFLPLFYAISQKLPACLSACLAPLCRPSLLSGGDICVGPVLSGRRFYLSRFLDPSVGFVFVFVFFFSFVVAVVGVGFEVWTSLMPLHAPKRFKLF